MSLTRLVSFFLGAAIFASALGAKEPADARQKPLVNLRTDYFPFHPPKSLEEWKIRRERVERKILVATGLWPMPARPTPTATIHGKVDRPEYTVERVSFESFPGHFVTGSLYRPKNAAGRRPGVLTPHGHWPNGRMHCFGDEEYGKQMAMGAERFDPTGHYPLQARCVQLARMGCVVFMYDMVGYGDSQQLTQEQVHAPTVESVNDGAAEYGFYSTAAESRLLGPMGLQTYNSLCALDWLETLPDVDPHQIAVTGASSGGTQTMMLCAIDPRPKVSFPVVMVSTAMQGGCGCENACCLRIGAGNVEFAALFAPRALGMASANDWTRDMIQRGLPELQKLYRLYHADDNVGLASLTQYPHNYNIASREAMYPWLKAHLPLDDAAPVVERDFKPLSVAELTVWDAEHPAPPSGRKHEVELLQAMNRAGAEPLAKLTPHDAASLAEYRRVVGGAFEVLLACSPPTKDEVSIIQPSPRDELILHCTVERPATGAQLDTVIITPPGDVKGVVLCASGAGRASVVTPAGELTALAQRLVEAGIAIVSADLLEQGATEMRVHNDPRPVPAITFGYNRTLVAERTADVLTLLAAAEQKFPQVKRIALLSLDSSAPYAAAAGALAGERLSATALEHAEFRFAEVKTWRTPEFLPGAVKYGDLPGLLALSAPRPLWLAGMDKTPEVVLAAYQAAGVAERVTTSVPGDLSAGSIDFLITHFKKP